MALLTPSSVATGQNHKPLKPLNSFRVEHLETLLEAETRKRARDLCGQIREQQTSAAWLSHRLTDPQGWNIEKRLERAGTFASELEGTISPSVYRARVATMEQEAAAADDVLAAAAPLVEEWAEARPTDLVTLQRLARELLTFPETVQSIRAANPDGRLRQAAEKVTETIDQLTAELTRVRLTLPRAGHHSVRYIRAAAETIERSGATRFLSNRFTSACNTYRNELGGSRKDGRAVMAARLREYARYLEKARAFEEEERFKECFGTVFRGLQTDSEMIAQVLAFYDAIERSCADNQELKERLETGDISVLRPLAEAPDASPASVEDARSARRNLQGRLEQERARVEEAEGHLALFRDREEITAGEIAEIARCKQAELELTSLIEAAPVATALGDRFHGTATDVDMLESECMLAETLAATSNPEFAVSVLQSGEFPALAEEAATFAAKRSKLESDISGFARALALPEALTTADALSERLQDLEAAAKDAPALVSRSHLMNSEEALRRLGFGPLVDWALDARDATLALRIVPSVRALVAKNMAVRAFELHSETLEGYTGQDLDRLRSEIAEKDRQLIAMSRQVLKHKLVAEAKPPAGNNVGPKSAFTDRSLIANELHKKKKRIGVRELTRRAGDALQELKPCWIMSPLAVSQYLHNKTSFDLVVIDEASQMTPENAIGAISRALQAVIVGDTKQLPPTSFFKKLLDDAGTEEDLREDSESVLEMANVAFAPIRQLRWHYRSRHSGLIRFSDKWMYDSQLTIFPSPQEDQQVSCIELVQIDGVYGGRTNQVEARAVVDAATRFMEQKPQLSLGICTMNTDQRDLLVGEFERERARNPKVEAYIQNWDQKRDGLEHFFIKNLETIQGDERDAMFVSTLYGPEASGGKVHQRFGPVNSPQGHWRLNVLFTRAKEKMVTFTSMKPADILADETKSKGVRMLRGWLEYCHHPGWVPEDVAAGGTAESPFEDHVARQVESLGYEAVPQVGASGYRINIGVRHKDWPYGFIMGVERDGATYHASRSSRERDRLRQCVLEERGWHLHRIWSTDWFNNPHAEREILKEKLADRLGELLRADTCAEAFDEAGGPELHTRLPITRRVAAILLPKPSRWRRSIGRMALRRTDVPLPSRPRGM